MAQTGGQMPTPEQVKDLTARLRAQLTAVIGKSALENMLYTYRDATDDQLRAYITFQASDVGTWYNAFTGKALLEALQEASVQALLQIRKQVLVTPGSQPANR